MRLFYILIFLYTFYFGLLAQGKETIWSPTYKHYTVNDGLAQSQVMCIMQDSRGYIWMGTKGGISRFNGERFENFYYKDSVPRFETMSFLEDGDGMIWAFARGEFGYYDGVLWKRILRKQINAAKKINNEIIGYCHQDTSLYKIKTSGATLIKKISYEELQILEVKNKRENAIYFSLTVNGKNNFYQYDNIHGIELISSLYYTDLQDLIQTSEYLYLSYNGTRSHFNVVPKHSRNIDISLPMPPVRPQNEYVNYQKSKGIEILAYSDFVYKLLPDRSGFEEIANTSAGINQIIFSRDQSIWCATENGVFQFYSTDFHHIPDKFLPQAWSIVEDNRNNYIINCYGHGLKLLSFETISDINVPHSLFKNKMNWKYFYFGATKDKMGNMYFDNNEYALKLDHTGKWSTIKGFESIDPKMGPIPLINYYDSLADCALFGLQKGVVMLNCKTDSVNTIVLDSIERGFIFSITADMDRNYWFGGFGLSKYNSSTKKIDFYSKRSNTLSFYNINSLESDRSGGMWIGTHDEGLWHKPKGLDSFVHIADHIIDRPISSLKIVDSFLIIGSIQGLILFNTNAFYRSNKIVLKTYNSHNGFPGLEASQNASYLDSKGNFWVLCANGAVTTHKSNLNTTTYPSKVRIYQINNEFVSFDSTQTIHLSKNENSLTIRFESIGFERTTIPEYSWRLKKSKDTPIASGWSTWSQDQIAYFANLPSNDYTFEVRTKHPGRIEEEYLMSDSYTFNVNNSFYKEPHFYKYTLFGSMVLGLAFLGLTRSLNINKRASKIAKLEAEKKEQQMKYYQIQSLQAQLNPHFIGNLLSTLHGFVGLERKEEALKHIEGLAILMRRFLESSKATDLNESTLTNKDISLDKEIDLLTHYIELEKAIRNQTFDYEIKIDEKVNAPLIYIPPMMIQPFVENAIKHGLVPLTINNLRRGKLDITFKDKDKAIICTIEDNGVGFDESKLNKKKDQVRSYGTQLVKERAALLRDFGYDIDIHTDSSPDKGTKVTIRFSERDE
jgi:two-component sensor histidine kinase